jgi:tRNA pseudouridine32 synthase / 23S rRNA pseudouridine746 synthase
VTQPDNAAEPLELLAATADYVVVNKPEGLASIPERFEHERCVSKLLAKQRGEQLFVVHRLDKEVSGVLVFARTAESHRALCMQFESQQVRKTYTAVVHGNPPENQGVVDSPLRQFGSGRMGVDVRRGKPCVTEFSVRERLNGYSILDVNPRTGRRHQIRVHLYSLGHPIVGDRRYGDPELQKSYERLLLHAAEITFADSSGAPVTVSSPLPESYTRILTQLRG